MHQYLNDTEFAVKNLIQLAIGEEKTLKELTSRLASVGSQLRVNKWDFESSDLSEDFSDVYVMAAFTRMAKVGQEAKTLQHQMVAIKASIGTHQQATQAIAGAILQIAKEACSFARR